MMFHKVKKKQLHSSDNLQQLAKYTTKCSNRLQITLIPGDFKFYQFYLKASFFCVNSGQKFLLYC